MLKTNWKMFVEQAEHIEEVGEGEEGVPKSNSIAGLITCSCLMYITLCHTVLLQSHQSPSPHMIVRVLVLSDQSQ